MRRFLYAIVVTCGFADWASASTLPHCRQRWTIDAAADLSPDSATITFAETRAPESARNRVFAVGCWTRESLDFAIRVHDADLIRAPEPLATDRFHAYDSLQIYLDPLADSSTSMNRDDIDVLLLPDGRSAVLRGDELWQEVDQARVPQRESAPLRIDYHTRIDDDGWSAVVRIPFAGLGIHPTEHRRLRWDLTMNDWRVDAATLPIAADDAPDAGSFSPLALSGARDFGFPKDWLVLDLVGTPPWHDTLLQRLGTGGFVLVFAGVLVMFGSVIFVTMQFLHRRRLRALLRRMALGDSSNRPDGPFGATGPRAGTTDRRAAAGAAHTVESVDGISTARAPERPAPADTDTDLATATTDDAVTPDVIATEGPKSSANAADPVTEFDPRDRAFAQQVLEHLRADLAAAHTPASLAAQFHVSVRTFQRKIKSGLGTNPQDLILAARLEHAHALLQRGELRVSEVAVRVGFDDLSHFSRRFRAVYGHAPSQVRQGDRTAG